MLTVDWAKSVFFQSERFDVRVSHQSSDKDRDRKIFAMTFEGHASEVIAQSLSMQPKRLTTVRSAARKRLGLAGGGRGATSYVPVLSDALRAGLHVKVTDDAVFFIRQVKPEIRLMLLQMAEQGLNATELATGLEANRSWVHDNLTGPRAPFKQFVVDGAELTMPELEGIVLLNAAVAIADVRNDIEVAQQGGGSFTPHSETLQAKVLELLGTQEEPGVWANNQVAVVPTAE